MELLESGDLDGALEMFEKLDDFEDSPEYVSNINAYKAAIVHLNAGRYEYAATAFDALRDFLDSVDQAKEAYYRIATALLNEGRYEEAATAFGALNDYLDSTEQVKEARYQIAKLIQGEMYIWFLEYEDLLDIDPKVQQRIYDARSNDTYNEQLEEASIELIKAAGMFESLGGYKDSAELASGIHTLMLTAEYTGKLWQLRFDNAAEFYTEYRERFEKLANNPEAAEKANECAAYEAYFLGRDLYVAGKFEEAAAQLKDVEIFDADLLHDFINAVIIYNRGNTFEALELAMTCIEKAGYLGKIRDLTEKHLFSDLLKGDSGWYYSEYTARMDVYAGFHGEPPLETSVPGLNFAKELISYWEAQVDAGINPAKIEKMPATIDWISIACDSTSHISLVRSRTGSMNRAITSQGLQSFYISTGSGSSPVEVTGFGIYVNRPANDSSDISFGFSLHSYINNPFFLADKPENARYLLLFTVSHSFHASWVYTSGGDFAGNSYHTTVTVTLKDNVTGRILYSGRETTRVPSDFFMPSDRRYYANEEYDTVKLRALLWDIYNEWL